MSENSAGPLPAGRHFRRRRFNLSMPARAIPAVAEPEEYHRPSSAAIPILEGKDQGERQFKRRVALVLVVLVVLSIPVLLGALILGG